LLTVGSGTAAGKASAAHVTTVTVTAGKPSELSFKVSKTSMITPGKVAFKVKNAGKLMHNFKVCTRPVKTSTANTCNGVGTKKLVGGQSTIITVNLKKGMYEFLCTIPGHAAAGMKGLLGIGVKVTAAATGTATGTTTSGGNNLVTGGGTSTSTTTTTASAGVVEPLVGDPVAGQAVWSSAGCATCHTMRAAGATGTVGPNLDSSKPGQDLVIQRVTNGINVMPAFGDQLNGKQIQDVASFVYKSTH
jgi:mono/diheme cytochrome c family protein